MKKFLALIILGLGLVACGDITKTTTDESSTTEYTDYGDGVVTQCVDGNCTVYVEDSDYYDVNASEGNISN